MTVHQLFALPAEEPAVLRPPRTGKRTLAILGGVAALHVGVLFASSRVPLDTSNQPHIVRTKVMEWHAVDASGEWADWRTDGAWHPALVRMPPRAFER